MYLELYICGFRIVATMLCWGKYTGDKLMPTCGVGAFPSKLMPQLCFGGVGGGGHFCNATTQAIWAMAQCGLGEPPQRSIHGWLLGCLL
jgi:hypothetical protein